MVEALIAVTVVAVASVGSMAAVLFIALDRFKEERQYYIKAIMSRDSRDLAIATDIEKNQKKDKTKLDNTEQEPILLDQLDGTDFDEHIESVMGKK